MSAAETFESFHHQSHHDPGKGGMEVTRHDLAVVTEGILAAIQRSEERLMEAIVTVNGITPAEQTALDDILAASQAVAQRLHDLVASAAQ